MLKRIFKLFQRRAEENRIKCQENVYKKLYETSEANKKAILTLVNHDLNNMSLPPTKRLKEIEKTIAKFL